MSNLDQWPTARMLITAGRLVENAHNEALAAYGITYAGLTILSVLAVHSALSQTQLAEALKVQAQTMGKSVDRLATKGLVTRNHDERDRRTQRVTITLAGRDLLEASNDLETKLELPGASDRTNLRDHVQTLIANYERKR